MRPREEREFSYFAKFFIEFQGYEFFDLQAGRIKEKYELWHGNEKLCRIMLERKQPLSRFKLLDKEGWSRGIKIRRLDE